MKRFITISLLLALNAAAWGCAWIQTTNYYLFSAFRREMMESNKYGEQIDLFWKGYTDGKYDSYRWNEDEIMEFAKQKNDTEMVNYLTHLNKYLDICSKLGESWNYPTKEELNQRKIDLNAMRDEATRYRGTRLKAQWLLLRMRSNMVLGNHEENVSLWKKNASKQPSSVYREMMQNIYAGALLHLGKRAEACEMFANQGDFVSIKWALRKQRNLQGIMTIYKENPNSRALLFLIQDFVNNNQESLDSKCDKEWVEDVLDARVVLQKDAEGFIDFAQNVIKEGKSKSPALWKAAIGELQYLYGEPKKAMETLNEAVSMEGTQRLKDNARAIRLVVSANANPIDNANYSNWLVEEMKWLVEKIKEEGDNNRENEYNYYNNHYYEVLVRLVHDNLVPKYAENGNHNIANLLLLTMDDTPTKLLALNNNADQPFAPSYSSEYFYSLDQMTAEQLISYKNFLGQKASDPLEAYLKSFNKDYHEEYYDDVIGTTYLANGEFAKAIPYLKKVSHDFLTRQRMYEYTYRDFTLPRWLYKQRDDNAQGSSTNKKVDFCQDMINLQSSYNKSSGETQKQLAYNLATRYYQASYLGDCWFITEYGQSITDTARVDRLDFVAEAIRYLNESAQSSNYTLHLNSLYGLAFIPNEAWCDWDYDWKNNKQIIIPHRKNRQYKALYDLNNYVEYQTAKVPKYVQQCDVLKKFRSTL